MIILHENGCDPGGMEAVLAIGFHKKTALIAKDFWLDQNYVWNGSRDELHPSNGPFVS
jgi:hypothetical protein